MALIVRILPLLLILTACAPQSVTESAVEYPDRIAEAAVSPLRANGDGFSAEPSDPAVEPLRAALDEYRRIEAAGGWPMLPAGPKLELGARGERVMILSQRLAASGDLAAVTSDPEVFDESLASAVQRFQARHGLLVDGIVGPETASALNVPIGQRITSIRLNLARLASESRDWGPRYIAVNIPAASYRLVEDGRAVLERPAIVGKPSWPTPRLDSLVQQLEFNPYWNVPPRIAKLELWPKIRRDTSYLARNHMHVVDGQIRQDPGPDNPLGVVKFIFDNPYHVYLHDTNNRGLFEKPKRFLSHGCMRVSSAVELAKLLLKADLSWPEKRIDEAIASGRTIRVDLVRPIPIHVVYDTVWVDHAGTVQFRDDVYGLDRKALAMSTNGTDQRGSACGAASH